MLSTQGGGVSCADGIQNPIARSVKFILGVVKRE